MLTVNLTTLTTTALIRRGRHIAARRFYVDRKAMRRTLSRQAAADSVAIATATRNAA